MSNDERVILYPLPHKIKGFICTDNDGGEIFFLNSRLTNESNRATMLHEIKHKKIMTSTQNAA